MFSFALLALVACDSSDTTKTTPASQEDPSSAEDSSSSGDRGNTAAVFSSADLLTGEYALTDITCAEGSALSAQSQEEIDDDLSSDRTFRLIISDQEGQSYWSDIFRSTNPDYVDRDSACVLGETGNLIAKEAQLLSVQPNGFECSSECSAQECEKICRQLTSSSLRTAESIIRMVESTGAIDEPEEGEERSNIDKLLLALYDRAKIEKAIAEDSCQEVSEGRTNWIPRSSAQELKDFIEQEFLENIGTQQELERLGNTLRRIDGLSRLLYRSFGNYGSEFTRGIVSYNQDSKKQVSLYLFFEGSPCEPSDNSVEKNIPNSLVRLVYSREAN